MSDEKSNVDIAHATLGDIVLKVSRFVDAECNGDIQLMMAVLNDSLFQLELTYRCGIIRTIEKIRKAKKKQ